LSDVLSRREVRCYWYDSAEYRPYRELRIKELTNGGSVVFVSGFDPVASAA
jgi:hypothetical protein